MYGRRPDTTDDRPWVHVGGGIYTTDEQVFVDTVEKMASFNIVDSVSVPSILHLRGKDSRVRSPQEILAACKTVRLAREGIRRSGRAGLPIINGISAASQPASMFAATYPDFGLRPSDGFLIDFLSEMVVGYEALQKVAFYNSISANIGSTSTPLFGGYAGGAEGVAVHGHRVHDHGQPDLPRQLPLQRPAAQQAAPLVHQAAHLGDRHVQRRHRPQHAVPDGQPAVPRRRLGHQAVPLRNGLLYARRRDVWWKRLLGSPCHGRPVGLAGPGRPQVPRGDRSRRLQPHARRGRAARPEALPAVRRQAQGPGQGPRRSRRSTT